MLQETEINQPIPRTNNTTISTTAVPVTRVPAKPPEPKPCSPRLPVEILSMIFELYVKLDCPVHVLLGVNTQWRSVALSTQPLWRRLLLSADAIPPSLRSGSVHACGSQETVNQVLMRSGVSKLEVTFVLGPNTIASPTPETRSALFRTVHANALSRVTFLCIIINPQMTLDLVSKSLEGVFIGGLPSLESMMIASAYAIGNLFDPLKPLLDLIDSTSPKLRSVYLENVNRDFILKANAYPWWTRLARLTIRNETDAIDASIFAACLELEFLSFSGEISYGPTNFEKPVEFPYLQWLRVGVISMGTINHLRLPVLHSMVIHTVQGNYPLPAPPHHTIELKALKILHVTTVNASVACIIAPKIETLCLGIPTLRSADADTVLNAIFDGSDNMIKPRHLTLTAPVHDKHLINALRYLPDLMSLQLDHQVPFSKTFFQAMTPTRARNKNKKPKQPLCPYLRCLVMDLHRAAAGMDLSQVGGGAAVDPNHIDGGGMNVDHNDGHIGGVGGGEEDPNLNANSVALIQNTPSTGGTTNWIRGSLLKLMEMRKTVDGCAELYRLACKWRENGVNEELVQPTMCISCIEVKVAGSS